MFHAPITSGDGDAPSPIRLRALSLGAGVQSTTLALMGSQLPGRRNPLRQPLSLRWLDAARQLAQRDRSTLGPERSPQDHLGLARRARCACPCIGDRACRWAIRRNGSEAATSRNLVHQVRPRLSADRRW